jgi:tetratricopeptide (TPR) repeat protein
MNMSRIATASLWLAFACATTNITHAGQDAKAQGKAAPPAAPAAGPKTSPPTLDAEFAAYEERLQTEPVLKVLRDAMQTMRERSAEIDKRHLEVVDAWVEEAVKADPTNVPLRMIVAEFRGIQGRPDDVILAYRELLKDPNIGKVPRAVVNNNLACALAARGSEKDLAEAAAAIGQAIEELGLTPDLLDTRATVRLAKGDFKEARADLKAALKQQPNGVLYFHLALVEEKAGDRKAQRDAMQQAVDIKVDRKQIPAAERKAFDRLKAQLAEKK